MASRGRRETPITYPRQVTSLVELIQIDTASQENQIGVFEESNPVYRQMPCADLLSLSISSERTEDWTSKTRLTAGRLYFANLW